MNLENIIFELYKKTTSTIPRDVIESLEKSSKNEDGLPKEVMERIIENCKVAKDESIPICQDTGTPIFYIDYGEKYKQIDLENAIKNATVKATKENLLRPNSVNPITGINSGDNLGKYFPVMHFNQIQGDRIRISLLLKGGGSENVGNRYTLPNKELNAGRNLEGVKKCILDSIYKAQGKGCSPGIVSACMGGSKDVISFLAKKQLLEKLGRINKNKELEKLEKEIIKKANSLDIGPMGFGGKTTVLDVKICSSNRAPASYILDVLYSCWALRRNTIDISSEGEVRYG